MSKKSNTLWFILGATVFNILTTMISFLVIIVLYAKFLSPFFPVESAAWAFPVIFVAAIALSFLIYRVVLKQLMKRINLEEHFDPIFGPRRNINKKPRS